MFGIIGLGETARGDGDAGWQNGLPRDTGTSGVVVAQPIVQLDERCGQGAVNDDLSNFLALKVGRLDLLNDDAQGFLFTNRHLNDSAD